MNYHLVVVHEFGNYTKGQKIVEPSEVAAVLEGHNHTSVVKIAVPEEKVAAEASPPDLPE